MASERNHLKAGLFVLLGLFLGLLVVFTLSDFRSMFERKQTLRISYSLADGVQGLKAGASVTLGDQPVGRVVAIEDGDSQEETDEQVRVGSKVVVFEIPRRYRIAQDAQIELVKPPLGSGTRLNISSVGVGAPYDPKGPPIDGAIAASALINDMAKRMGIEDAQRKQLQEIIANVRDLSARLKDDVPAITATVRKDMVKLEPLLDNANVALADVRVLTGEIRQKSVAWMERIDSVTTSAQSSLSRVDKLLADKDPTLRKTVDNVHDVTDALKTKTLVQLDTALENVKKSTDELKVLMVGQRPQIERMMANLQLSAAQLKLATIEIRRSPWRLLYTPKDKELETDNLYDAARSFALAAEALQGTAQTLQALELDPKADPQHIKQMLVYLQELFGHFQGAENAFWKALGQQAPLSPAHPAKAPAAGEIPAPAKPVSPAAVTPVAAPR